VKTESRMKNERIVKKYDKAAKVLSELLSSGS